MTHAIFRFILLEFIKPMSHRIGSALGVYLASADIFATGEIDTIETAITLLSGYAIDLVVRKVL